MSPHAWIVAASLPLAGLAPAAAAPEAAQVKSTVEGMVNAVIGVLKDKANDRDARRRKIFALTDPVVDFALMGKLTLGRAHWPAFDEAQRAEFIDSFRTAVRDSTYEKIEVYTNETVQFDPPAPAEKGKYVVQMYVFSKGQRYKALFKLYRDQSSWKVYDLEIEGISLVKTYSAQYDQVLRKESPKALLAKLRTKALATPEGLKAAASASQRGPAAKP